MNRLLIGVMLAFAKIIAIDIVKWAKVVKPSNIKAD